MESVVLSTKILIKTLKLNNFIHNDNILYSARAESTSSSWTWEIVFKYRGKFYLTHYTEFIGPLGGLKNSWENEKEMECWKLDRRELNGYMGKTNGISSKYD